MIRYNPMTILRREVAFVSILMTAWLVLAVIFAGVFVIAGYDHAHIGENCPVCLGIQIALRLIEAFARLGISIVLTGFIVYALSFVRPQLIFYSFNSIPLKVKFNC
jgi:hypothetical protein